MITNYKNFLDNLINESSGVNQITKEDFINVSKITKLVRKLESDGGEYIPTYNHEQILNNINLLSSEINKFEECIIGSVESAYNKEVEGIEYNRYKRGLEIYIKTKVYNRLVKILYGKEYVNKSGFNPHTDSTKVLKGPFPIGYDRSEATLTRGQLFSQVWEDTDDYCNMSIEYLLTGVIEDTLGDVVQDTAEIAIWTIIAIAIATIMTESAAAVGIGAGVVGVTRLVATEKQLSFLRKSIIHLKKKINVDKVIQIAKKHWPELFNLLKINTGFQGILAIGEFIKKQLSGGDINITREDTFDKLSKRYTKEIQIGRVYAALEGNSKFKAFKYDIVGKNAWMYNYLKDMPGWKEWTPSKDSEKTNQGLYYEILWYVSEYCYEYQLFCYGYLEIQKYIKQFVKMENQLK